MGIPSVTKYDTTKTKCSLPLHGGSREHRRPCKHVRALLDAIATVKEWEDHHKTQLMPPWTAII